jgi:hypothetical protein
LQEDDLELDRVLGPVRQLVVEQVLAGQRGDAVDVGQVGARPAQRGLEILAGQGEPVGTVLVRHAQDHERIGVGPFGQFPVRPGVDRPAALEVDVRAQDAAQGMGACPSPSAAGRPAPRSWAKNWPSCARSARSVAA